MTIQRWFGLGLLAALVVVGPSRSRAGSILSEYNLVVRGDLSGRSHVDLNTFVGGNLTTANNGSAMDFSLKSYTVPGNVGLTVAGNVQAQNAGTFKVLNGKSAVVGGTVGSSSNVLSATSVATGVPGLDVLRDSIFAELATLSNLYRDLDVNSAVEAVGNNLNFLAAPSGPDNVAVFTINASDLENPAIGQINLATNGASSIIINVLGTGSGGTFDFGGKNFVDPWNTTAVRATTLWNFVDATTINLDSNWSGAILALNAHVHNKSNIDGSVFANTMFLGGEVHQPYYTGFVPTVAPVPEPSGIVLGLIGVGTMAGAALRRRLRARAAA